MAQLEVLVRGLPTVDRNDNATDPGEYLKQSWAADSRWQLSARLDPERGALVGAAIDALVERDGGSAVDASAVARPYARVAGGPGLPDQAVQRLLCEGRIRTVIHAGAPHQGAANVLDVGRSHRLVTDRQYRALLQRQHGHCAHPGCPNTKTPHAHHRIHWIHGGRTDLNNLLLLCERHHLAHHAGEFDMFAAGAGRFRFVSSDGRDLSAPVPGPASKNTKPLEDEPHVAPDAAITRWDGQRLDRPYAISVLAQRRQATS